MAFQHTVDYGATNSNRQMQLALNTSISQAPDKYQPPFGAISRKSSITVGILNILCTSLDGTALTIPYAMWKCGILGGTILLVGYAFGTVLTLQFICIAARKLRAASYTEIVHRLFGQTFGLLFSGILLLVLFAILVGFLILMRQIGSDLLTLVAGNNKVPPPLVMVLCALLCLPFMLAESLHKLRYSCYLGFISIILVLGCLSYSVQHPTTQYRVINFLHVKYLPANLSDVLEAVPVFTMLYISHFNVLGVFTQLEKPTPHRMNQVIYYSVAIMTALFVAFGVVGYFVFFTLLNGRAVDNILRAFPPHHRALLVGRACLLITLICTIPVMLIPARSILMEYYEDLLIYWEKQSPTTPEELSTYQAPLRRSEPYVAAAGSVAPLSGQHGGYSAWLDGTLFANRTHHADHVASPGSSNPRTMSDASEAETKTADIDALEAQRHPDWQIESPPHTPLSEAPPSPPTPAADESDVGVGFEGLESHWRDWRALVAPMHSLDPRGRSSFQRELDAAERAARAARLARQAAAAEEAAPIDLIQEDAHLLEGHDAVRASAEGAQEGVEMVGLSRSSTAAPPASAAVPHPSTAGIQDILKWRCLRLPRGGEASHRQRQVRYTLTILILALVLATAYVVPDSVSKVWQVAGSSVGLLISLVIPSLVYLKLRRVLHAKADLHCLCAWGLVYITAPLLVLCSIHNIR